MFFRLLRYRNDKRFLKEKLTDSPESNTSATTKLIPFCGLMHPEDLTKFRRKNDGIQLRCTDFIPSISNDGLCVTRNALKITFLKKILICRNSPRHLSQETLRER